ncbi:hypothetical protein L6164_032325 [Bauhinia variegata]|uniref:Uncharacterized protein n=1 Tax=Bauhinia variegata TaxID=167791 RepID=A0ACB9KNC0_BAUVA|nr:hypothetical protein L6164_032325 [Bauhinia variegata]
MDQNEDYKLQSTGFSILPQSFSTYFSTFLFSMFAHTLERKYMFVIFNGILAFLVKSSVFTSPSISASNIEIPLSLPPETKLPAYDQEVEVSSRSTFGSPESASLMPEQEDHKEQASEVEEQEGGGENKESIVEEEEDYEGETGSEVLVKQDDEADTPSMANEGLDNTEELNRKFEEFIRKMKEEIRIEAQR